MAFFRSKNYDPMLPRVRLEVAAWLGRKIKNLSSWFDDPRR
jgi:hypothetical protein